MDYFHFKCDFSVNLIQQPPKTKSSTFLFASHTIPKSRRI